jgi:hypothetical protein
MIIKCLVACTNSNGEPELLHIPVECSQEEYDNGKHYEKAKAAAEDEGYESPVWVADENDPGFFVPNPEEELPEEGLSI